MCVRARAPETRGVGVMTRRKPPYIPEPRIWTRYQVAARLGKSETWFRRHREYLEHLGFPRRDEDLEGWDGDAINHWIDSKSGLPSESEPDQGQGWLERVGEDRNPLRSGGKG